MNTIKNTAIDRAIKTLAALGCVYVVVRPTGERDTHGELPKEPKPWKRGDLKAHVLPYMEKLSVGESVKIPFGGYDPAAISQAASATSYSLWGAGNYMTQRSDEGGYVEVLCLGTKEGEDGL